MVIEFDLAADNRCPIALQSNHDLTDRLEELTNEIAYIDLKTKLLVDFSAECITFDFTLLDLASGKLPQIGGRAFVWTLCRKHFPVSDNDSSDD